MVESIKLNPPIPKRPLTKIAKKFFLLCENPLGVGLLVFLFYATIAIYSGAWEKATLANYYSYLADAFIHGLLHLRLQPPQFLDLSLYQGKMYLYWPPLPAVLSIPLVLLFGVNFSDSIFTIVVTSINIVIVAQLLRKCNSQNLIELTAVQRGMLVFTFGFGSVQATQAIKGTVWAISLITGLMFVGLTYLIVMSAKGWKAFLLAGLSIAAALATRYTLILTGIWPAYYLFKQHWSQPWKKKIGFALLAATPVLLTLVGLGLYNYVRFGSVLEFGYSFHNMFSFFKSDFEKYGFFNLHYIPRNLYYQWIAYPFLSKNSVEFLMGGSLLLLSPVFFGMFWARKNRSMRNDSVMLSLTMVVVYIPIVLLMGTGYEQLGPRYTLDFMIPLLILTGMGIKYWPTRITGILVAISFLHYFTLVILSTQYYFFYF